MRSSDIGLSVMIFIVFAGLLAYAYASQGMENIKKNWPKYRCNPGVMPFAGVFGYDASENFSSCIGQIQQDMMGFLTMPMSFNLSMLGDLGGSITNSLGSIRGVISNIRSQITAIIGKVMAVFLNLMIQIQQILILVKDIIGKFVGVLAAVMHLLSTFVTLGDAIWKGTPGKIARAMCFHPKTVVQLESGEDKPMCDVYVGEVLKGGSRVCATMRISNLDEKGEPIECLYELQGGVGASKIKVSGSHLAYCKDSNKFKAVRHFSEADGVRVRDDVCTEFSCLITSNHLIPIGRWLFHDWEDNVGSKSKSPG